MSNLMTFRKTSHLRIIFISAYNKILSIDGTMSWMEGFGISGFLLYPTIALEIILPLFIIIGYQANYQQVYLLFSVSYSIYFSL